MAYLFSPMPTFKEFIDQVKELGIEEGTEPDKNGKPCRCLKRTGRPPVFLPKDFQDTDIVQPSQLSSWCRNLEIPAEQFGFDAGWLENPLGGWNWE